MTKHELIKDIERLEQELHNAQNSCLYWEREAEQYIKLYNDLNDEIQDDGIMSFLKECSITQKQQLEDFISSL